MRRWGLISPAFFCYAEIKKRKRRKSLLTTIMIGNAEVGLNKPCLLLLC
nr:MAG TPA: hypothetical protein [Caudoviricetes sp.]